MKTGNVTGNVYKRSVHRKTEANGTGIKGAGYGEDCAFFTSINGDKASENAEPLWITAQSLSVLTGADGAALCVYDAVNRAAAAAVGKGEAKVRMVSMQLMLPTDCPEEELQKMTTAAQSAAKKLQVTLADVKAHVTAAVSAPVATAEAIAEVRITAAHSGTARSSALASHAVLHNATEMCIASGSTSSGRQRQNAGVAVPASVAPHAGQQIVMTKWAGLAGTVRLEKTYREKLLQRYPAQLLDDAAQLEQHFSILPEAAVAGKSGVGLACAVSESGVFHALWTMAEQTGTGLEVALKKIPIRQETVEICNELDVNPYELSGTGSMLFVTDQGEALVQQLEQQGIAAAVIGFLSADNDRVIVNGEERRFLEPANVDAIYRME